MTCAYCTVALSLNTVDQGLASGYYIHVQYSVEILFPRNIVLLTRCFHVTVTLAFTDRSCDLACDVRFNGPRRNSVEASFIFSRNKHQPEDDPTPQTCNLYGMVQGR